MKPDAKPRIGLLPLFLALYDKPFPELRKKQSEFSERIAKSLQDLGLEVIQSHPCSLRKEFEEAVDLFQERKVDGIVTLHLTYCPSLEAADALCRTSLPVLMLNTTPAECFGEDATWDTILENHGIHGVQDLASVLFARKRKYQIITTRPSDRERMSGVATWARCAAVAHAFRTLRTALIGKPFEGMGDFQVDFSQLQGQLGTEVVEIPVNRIAELAAGVSDADLEAEIRADRAAYSCEGVDADGHRLSVRAGLAVRRALEEENAGAVAMNFQAFTKASGVPTVPFLEASKLLARGIGYAGEGDVLSATLVAALTRFGAAVTFGEMFCPDFEGGSIFMSHMGELNPKFAKKKPKLVIKNYPFGDVPGPAILLFPVDDIGVTLANLAPGRDGQFKLVYGSMEIREFPLLPRIDAPHFKLAPTDETVEEFLTYYSELGGGHHLALIKGDLFEEIGLVGEMLGLDVRPCSWGGQL